MQVEALNITDMAKNSRLARAFNDAGMGEFVRMLEYKCAWYGTAFVKIDCWYPSSKTCSACGACDFACAWNENAARNIQAYPTAAQVDRRRHGDP